MIVSHFGTHMQEAAAFEAIVHLLKPGGEAIVSGDAHSIPPIRAPADFKKHYEILGEKDIQFSEFSPHQQSGRWGYHIRKAAAKP